jgi:ATP-dependent Clp protease ATP-binding subunit ClpA
MELIGPLSKKAQSAMVIAGREALRSKSEKVRPIHILIAILTIEVVSGKFRAKLVLEHLGCAIEDLLKEARRSLHHEMDGVHSWGVPKAPETVEVLMSATSLRDKLNCTEVRTDHLLYGLAVYAERYPVEVVGVLFQKYGITAQAVVDEINNECEE